MSILSWDLETTTKKTNKRVANPFDPDNYVVASGWKYDNGKPEFKYWKSKHNEEVLPDLTNVTLIIGFNIKFDLLYAWHEKGLQAFLKRGGMIYDGQYMEYLLNGMTQENQMMSMNETAARYYEGGSKIDAVKEMWQSGICTKDIPKDLLIDYLVGDGKEVMGDIENTYQIFAHQVKRAKAEMHPNFMQMFKHRMDGLLATTEMEYNGMFVNQQRAEELRTEVVKDLAIASDELENYIPELPPELTFNWNSNVHKSAIIFGGTVKYKKWTAHLDEDGEPLYAQKTEQWPLFNKTPVHPDLCILKKHKVHGELYVVLNEQGKYTLQDMNKGGKNAGVPKTKNMKVPDTTKPKGAQKDYHYKFDGYTQPEAKWEGALLDATGNPTYSVASDVIEELGGRGINFLDALLKRTALAKDLGTYYWEEDSKGKRKGMLTLVDEQGIIHHKLNHTSTVTSRMSSSDPNMQNIPRGDTSNVKKMFTSRFDDGEMAEIDYSQLEVVVQGVLSNDVQLRKDLNDKVDFHIKRLATKLDEPYDVVWKRHHIDHCPVTGKLRTGSKNFSFQRAYGAGAKAIAASTGMHLDDVNALIEAEETMYPGVVEFDKKLEATINNNRIPTDNKIFINGLAFSQGEGHWDCPTGTRYIWREHETPKFMHDKGKFVGFSPTERKNYGVQGMGGEIVQTMLGKVFRYFLENDRFNNEVLLVNTVHDCVLLDGKSNRLPYVAKQVQTILEAVPTVFNKSLGMNIDVPFPCETEVGKDLFAMTTI